MVPRDEVIKRLSPNVPEVDVQHLPGIMRVFHYHEDNEPVKLWLGKDGV
jgi:hypothetical protein